MLGGRAPSCRRAASALTRWEAELHRRTGPAGAGNHFLEEIGFDTHPELVLRFPDR